MTTTITARVDADRKAKAEEVFSDLGLTFSSAINLFVNAVVIHQGIPFSIERHPSPRKGVKIGLARNRWNLPADFDEKFDALDGEAAAMLEGERP